MTALNTIRAFLTLMPLAVAGCATQSTPAGDADRTKQVSTQRCSDAREVTGSRLKRCDSSGVGVISGEEIQRSGMPTTGGQGAAQRGQ